MGKDVKYTEKLILWISGKQKKELEDLAKTLGRSKSDLVREAIARLINEYRKK